MSEHPIYVYIKRGAGDNDYITLAEPLSADSYANIGSSYQDYLSGKYVPLSDEQLQYHTDNPEAGIEEVLLMKQQEQPTVPEPSEEYLIAEAKAKKLAAIEEYANGNEVNRFTINTVVEGWLTPVERSNYLQSLTSAELLGETEVDFFVGTNFFTLPLQAARLVLAKIQRYADASYIVTVNKKIALSELITLSDVENFDVTSGYPEPLNFDFIEEASSEQHPQNQE